MESFVYETFYKNSDSPKACSLEGVGRRSTEIKAPASRSRQSKTIRSYLNDLFAILVLVVGLLVCKITVEFIVFMIRLAGSPSYTTSYLFITIAVGGLLLTLGIAEVVYGAKRVIFDVIREATSRRIKSVAAVLSGLLIILTLGVWLFVYVYTHVEVLYELNQGTLYYQTHWGDFVSFFLAVVVAIPVGMISGVLVFKRCYLKWAAVGICVLLLPLLFLPSELYPLKELPIDSYRVVLSLSLPAFVLVLGIEKEFKERKIKDKRILAFCGVLVLLFLILSLVLILAKKPKASDFSKVWIGAYQKADSTEIEVINWWDTTLDGLLIKYGYGGKQESVSIDTIPSGGAYRITIPQRLEDNSWISLDVTHVPSLEKFYGGKIQVDGEMVRVGRKEDEYWMKAINIDNHTEVRLGFFEFEPWRWRDSTLLIMYSENLMRPDEQISFESLENRNGVLVATLDKKLEETQQLSVEIVDYSTNGDPVLTVNGPPVRERVWRFICGTGAMIAWEQRMMGATFLSIFVSIMLAIFMLLLGILLRPSSRLG